MNRNRNQYFTLSQSNSTKYRYKPNHYNPFKVPNTIPYGPQGYHQEKYSCGSDDVENFRFEVTPAKKCALGPYMTQSGPNHELCKKMWSSKEGREQISKYSCLNGDCGKASGMEPSFPYGGGAYTGRPLHFKRDPPMSNHLWQNDMCS
tara:strand:- start:35 stop:478 length:444 start_codon:yes stop_codon:yes gene_type:complete